MQQGILCCGDSSKRTRFEDEETLMATCVWRSPLTTIDRHKQMGVGMSGQKIQVPYFDGQSLELDEDQASLPNEAQEALAAFLSLTNEQRLSEPSLVYQYYQDFRGVGDFADWLDEEMGVLTDDETIWARVSLDFLDVRQGINGLWYVVAAGDCDWDREHGIMMVWLQGAALTRVGPDDGDLGDYDREGEADQTSVIYL